MSYVVFNFSLLVTTNCLIYLNFAMSFDNAKKILHVKNKIARWLLAALIFVG